MKLQGIFLPTTTPFDHRGDLYRAKVSHNLENWNSTSLAGYVVCGSTGESVSLSFEEKATLCEWVAEYAASGKKLVVAGGASGVRETVRLIAATAELGYEAVLIRLGQGLWSADEQMLYIRAVADQSKLPVIVDAGRETMTASLPRHPNIIATVVESPPAAKPAVDILAGSDAAVWPCLSAGATGAIPALANAAPYALITIWEAHRTREAEAAADWQERISYPAHLVTAKYGIPGLKYAMDLNGYYGGPCRLPLAPISSAAKREIEEAFHGLRG